MRLLIPLVALLALAPLASAQESAAGFVRDAETGEPLPGATVIVVAAPSDGVVGTTTNRSGYFALALPTAPTALRVSYVGYADTTLAVPSGPGALALAVGLRASDLRFEEAIVQAERVPYGSATLVGTQTLSARDLADVPTPGGENDLFRALQFQPGVKAGSEVNSGLYVRGGSADQNLILLDGVPVYNPWHLFGFFSTFNADAVKDVRLVKGVPPAEYGERLGAVVDLTLREGRRDRVGGTAHLGLVSSRLFLEGPAGPRASFALSGRSTYLERALSFGETVGLVSDADRPAYSFSDVTAKVGYELSPVSRLSASAYYGWDRLKIEQDGVQTIVDPLTGAERQTPSRAGVRYGWENVTLGLRYERSFGARAFLTARAYGTEYRFRSRFALASDSVYGPPRSGAAQFTLGPASAELGYDVSVRDLALRADLDVYGDAFGLRGHSLRVGAAAIGHDVRDLALARADPFYDYLFTPDSSALRQRPLELAAYVQDEWAVTGRLRVQAGVRAAAFTSAYAVRVSPRLAARYTVGPWAVAAGAGHTAQFVQQVADELVPIPSERWIPAGDGIGVADAYQIAFDVERSMGAYRVTVGLYARALRSVYATSPIRTGEGYGEDDFALLRPQLRLPVQGEGAAYGGEVLVEKRRGRVTGQLGYTLARAERRYAEIGGGVAFPTQQDRLHEVEAVAQYALGRWRLGAAFTWGSGQPLSLPVGYSLADDPLVGEGPEVVFDYAAYRTDRTAPMHRLDLTLEGPVARLYGNPLWLSVDVYNAYGRENPLVTVPALRSDDDGTEQLTVLRYGGLPAVPSASLRYEF